MKKTFLPGEDELSGVKSLRGSESGVHTLKLVRISKLNLRNWRTSPGIM